MAIELSELKQLALDLKENKSEVAQRSSASRGYYFAYHVCLEHADNQNMPAAPYEYNGAPVHGVHEKLITRYLTYDDIDNAKQTNIRSIGHILNAMRSIRRNADYNLNLDFDASQADTIMAHAEKIIEKLENDGS